MNLNNGKWNILFALIAPVLFYFGYSIFIYESYQYDTRLSEYKSYFWIFTDSAKKDIDTLVNGGRFRNTDAIYHYIYKQKYYIMIWDIYEMNHIDLNNIQYKINNSVEDIELFPKIVFNEGSYNEEHVKLTPFIKDTIILEYDNSLNIKKYIKGKNFNGFYGEFKKLAISNKSEVVALINHPGGISKALFLLYKNKNNLYLILIDSESYIDNDIHKILNLN